MRRQKMASREQLSIFKETSENENDGSAGPRNDIPLKQLFTGYSFVFAHALFMTISSACVQELHNVVPHFELVLLRFIALLIISSITLLIKRDLPNLSGNIPLQMQLLMASAINTTTFTLYYASSYYISLGPVAGVYRATTLIVSILLSRIVLLERISLEKIIASLFSVIGISMILISAGILAYQNKDIHDTVTQQSPSFWSTQSLVPDQSSKDTEGLKELEVTSSRISSPPLSVTPSSLADPMGHHISGSVMVIGYSLVILAGISNSIELILLAGFLRNVKSGVQSFWFGVVGTLSSSAILIFTDTPHFPSGVKPTALFVIHGLAAAMSIYTFIYALKYLPASNAAITQSIHIAFMYIVQYTVVSSLNPFTSWFSRWVDLAGASVIVLGVLALPILDYIRQRHQTRYREQLS